MYVPKFFASDDGELSRRIVHEHAFGMLMTLPAQPVDCVDISHLPMLWLDGEGTRGRIIGHVAKANAHGARFDGAQSSVAVFSGPHAYISPNMYENEGLVPTWNYAAVHLHGKPNAVTDEQGVIGILDLLVSTFESDVTGNWSTANLPDGALVRQIKGIIAFEMQIEHVETKVKMSQNRQPDDIAGAIDALSQSAHQDDRATAEMMQALNGT